MQLITKELNDILDNNNSSFDKFFVYVNFILIKDCWAKSNKARKKRIETNYKVWTEEEYNELHDKFIEGIKRNNKMDNIKDDDLDVEFFEKPYSITKNHVKFRIFLAITRGVSRCITGTRTKIEGHLFNRKMEKILNYCFVDRTIIIFTCDY